MVLSFEPPIIAHRGVSIEAPENTLAAFVKAAQLGLKWIEFDVMLTACKQPVIFHDEPLDRTTNGSGALSHYPYTYLQTLDAGSWFSPQFSGERIPTLAQTLAFLKEVKMAANIEIKALPHDEEETVKSILKVMQPYFSIEDEAILFSSFSTKVLYCLREFAPDCQIGLLLDQWHPHDEKIATSLRCSSIHINEAAMSLPIAQHIKEMNKVLLCYTVNTAHRAQELYRWGVDAVFSDNPESILRG